MPIVFVHGVNTRREHAGYETGCALIQEFLNEHLVGAVINGKKLNSAECHFPYWGDLATTFAWNMASLPSGDIDALGGAVEPDLRLLVSVLSETLADQQNGRDEPLLTLAKHSFSQGVQVVSDLVLGSAINTPAAEVAAFVVRIQSLARTNARPAWLNSVTTDAQFVNRLVVEASQPNLTTDDSLGVVSKIGDALGASVTKLKMAVRSTASTVLDRTGDFASTRLLAWGRQPLNGIIGRFFGDVFVYFNTRGEKASPGSIPKRVLGGVERALQSRDAGEPLVVIGHSLGGVITFDLLSHFRSDLPVDLFVSVGSQVSHFEEVKLFRASDPKIRGPHGRAKTAQNIAHWINVFDEVDIFSYACEGVFDRVNDYHYDTNTYTIKAHGAYFEQDRFYRRLRARIDQLL